MFSNKKVLITGGTGSLGTALVKHLVKTGVDTIRIYSRDEWKQTKMLEEIDDQRLRFLIGDIRDKERLSRAMEDIDIVIHAAALKHVPIGEYNPFETIKTNVNGSQNVVEACLDNDVKIVIGIGTDKAVLPFNTYGATKLLMEKIFTSANFYRGNHNVKFLCVRYGNVLGSKGSVLPKFLEQIRRKKEITITDPLMTRFNITMNEAVELVMRAIKSGNEGEIFVPKLPAYTLGTLKDAILELVAKKVVIKKIPLRTGEKLHETLISEDELCFTHETKLDYVITNPVIDKISSIKKLKIKKTPLDKAYSSNSVPLLKKQELKNIIIKEGLLDEDSNVFFD